MKSFIRRAIDVLLDHLRFKRRYPVDAYLAQSVDLVDLERRLQHLSRGVADGARQRLSFMARARS